MWAPSGVAANEGIGPYILKVLSLTPPKLSFPSTASQPGPASVDASSTPLLAAHPLPAGTACLSAALSPLLPKAAGCGFFISFRCFFSFQGFVLPCLSHGGGGALVSQALLMRGEPDTGGLGGRALCLVGAGCFLGVFWVFSGCLISDTGSSKPAQQTQDGVTHIGRAAPTEPEPLSGAAVGLNPSGWCRGADGELKS